MRAPRTFPEQNNPKRKNPKYKNPNSKFHIKATRNVMKKLIKVFVNMYPQKRFHQWLFDCPATDLGPML